MKNFQKNQDISEQDLKVRLYSMITLGSLLGDGSDYRNKVVAQRAEKCLNNAAVSEFFSHPKAFTPLRFPESNSQSQQLSFYLPGDILLVSIFNFDLEKKFTETFFKEELQWKDSEYVPQDFLTGQTIGKIEKGSQALQ